MNTHEAIKELQDRVIDLKKKLIDLSDALDEHSKTPLAHALHVVKQK